MLDSRNWISFVLLVIVLLSVALRWWNLDFGLPQMLHPDEINKVQIAQNILRTGDLNPHYFKKPSFFIYLNVLIYFPYYWLSGLDSFQALQAPETLGLGIGFTTQPTTVILQRSLSAFSGVCGVLMMFFVGKRVGNTQIGLLAALLLAVLPTHVGESHFITTNTFVVFFSLLALYGALGIYLEGRWRDYLLAGLACGLTVSSKYNGGLIVVVVIVAHFLRFGRKSFSTPYAYVSALIAILTFVITNPYTVLDFNTFWNDFSFEANHYSSGHPGMEGAPLLFYLNQIWTELGIISILAIGQLVVAIRQRQWKWIIVATFPVIYFAFIVSFVVRNDRTGLPLLPFMIILGSGGAFTLIRWFTIQWGAERQQIVRFATVITLLLMFAWPFAETIKTVTAIGRLDSRTTAFHWINLELPPSRVAFSSYSPFLDETRFKGYYIHNPLEIDPAWYVDNEIDYLILSQGWYGRYYRDLELYSDEIQQYEQLTQTFELHRQFQDGDYTISIYKIMPLAK